jgi:TetR/AcrR family transcriptional regulator, transcriptional repressor for nem operon
MTSRDDKKEQSHETILDSAAQLVRQQGIAGARVADVMKGAGLTVGGFYAHFGSKKELIDAAMRRTEEKPAADRAMVIVKRYLSAAHRDLQTEGCPLPAVLGEVGTTASEHRDVILEQIDALAEGIKAELPANHPMSRWQLALGLIALMYGGLTMARALRGTQLSDEIIKACRGLAAVALRRKP